MLQTRGRERDLSNPEETNLPGFNIGLYTVNFLLDDSSIRVQVLFLIFADSTAMRKLNPLIL